MGALPGGDRGRGEGPRLEEHVTLHRVVDAIYKSAAGWPGCDVVSGEGCGAVRVPCTGSCAGPEQLDELPRPAPLNRRSQGRPPPLAPSRAHRLPDDDGSGRAGLGAVRPQRDLDSRPRRRNRSRLQLGLFDFRQRTFCPFHPGADVVLDGCVSRRVVRPGYRRPTGRSGCRSSNCARARQELARSCGGRAPENRYYHYDYYRDNCSTRVRDALDRALGGVIRTPTDAMPRRTTYRFHTQRLTANDPLMFTGLLLALGHRWTVRSPRGRRCSCRWRCGTASRRHCPGRRRAPAPLVSIGADAVRIHRRAAATGAPALARRGTSSWA